MQMRLIFAVTTACCVSACTSVPGFNLLPTKDDGPPATMVVDHIRCTLAAIKDQKLTTYTFVASVDLTLKVSENAAFGPSLNFITPYTAAQTNFTAAVGGELNGTRDRDMEFSFALDFAKLDEKGCPSAGDALQGDALQGDLGLGDIVKAGLASINTTQTYNIYGSSGPSPAVQAAIVKLSTARTDLTADKRAHELLSPLTENKRALQDLSSSTGDTLSPEAEKALQDDKATVQSLLRALPPTAAPAQELAQSNLDVIDEALSTKTPAKKGASSSSGTTFGSTIDFILIEGLNGGLTWTLKYFKGFGGGTPPLSISRTTTDSLQITFTPTCNSTISENYTSPSTFWDAIPSCKKINVGEAQQNANQLGHDQNTRMLLQTLTRRLPIQ
jgi:hypothetical protein